MINWKTTLAGAIGAFVALAPQVVNCIQGQPCNWQNIAFGLAFGALGFSSKDHNVTGGTKPQ